MVFVLGQIIIRVVLEPWQDYRECVGNIAHKLLFYANVYGTPGFDSDEKSHEAKNDLRNLSAEYTSTCMRIPFYRLLSLLKLYPKQSEQLEVQKCLIGLSNSTFKGDGSKASDKADKVRRILGIPTIE